ncbi:MAG: hypothetical protein HC779_07770 [Phyllobacteriaceae bacterium]|nr:hypothetical protein [Phyllobacteriaceae bacterium]
MPAILEGNYRDTGLHRQPGGSSLSRHEPQRIEELTDAFLVSEPVPSLMFLKGRALPA